MPHRPRPLLTVRLIGPADVVAAHKAHLLAYLAETLEGQATCRTSTRPASYTNEIRVYITVARREVMPR